MAISRLIRVLVLTSVFANFCAGKEDDMKDFDFVKEIESDDPKEIMIAQESRQYKTIVKAPIRIVKPNGITNSHRPQYNLDSYEEDHQQKKFKRHESDDLIDFFDEPTVKPVVKYNPAKLSFKSRSKEAMIRDAVLRALERKDHVGKFAQILPIIRAMSGSQRIALASLVASQVNLPPGRSSLNLSQVRSMFGNNENATSNLMLPILLDMANLIKPTVRSNKVTREVKEPPNTHVNRRSYTEGSDTSLEEELFDTGTAPHAEITSTTSKAPTTKQTNTRTKVLRNRHTIRNKPQRVTNISDLKNDKNILEASTSKNIQTSSEATTEHINDIDNEYLINENITSTKYSEPKSELASHQLRSRGSSNITIEDLMADATNDTFSQEVPVAEKLRGYNRFTDRKGFPRRGYFKTNKPAPSVTRRTTVETTISPIRRKPPRKLPFTPSQAACELFTNSLCLHSEDYPTEAIVQSIRRNKAAASALLADFRDPGEGALDGVSSAQEAKYTADHYLTSNRRGDTTATRDFASAGEAGFMCPSTVKYARPQRARATSGQWKYIVNTGEHTQTLRLEKCLKPKESCTYLTDNFKSKCIQVYNYHRLLTWDQPNGLHMDIFKVPTCCSCHIEGYSVAFPPLGHRVHESSSEQFVGEDLSSDHGNNAFESVQSSVQRPILSKKQPFAAKPLDLFPTFGDNHNIPSGAGFSNDKLKENEEFNSDNDPNSAPMNSYGNSYYPDTFNQASSIKYVKKPVSTGVGSTSGGFDAVTLPSYLEPPTPQAGNTFLFGSDKLGKFKGSSHHKRPARPIRRPIRKQMTSPSDDLMSSGTSAIGSVSDNMNIDDLVDHDEDNSDTKQKYHEKISTTVKPNEQTRPNSSPGKRINYNYHPILEFFEKQRTEEGDVDAAIDREDITYEPQSEWKPIDHPISRGVMPKLSNRKKYK